MLNSVRVLVVDDFEIVRLTIKNSLRELGLTQIEEAQDGRVALKKIEESHAMGKPFDMVFCDWNMPEITGLEVIQICRSKPELNKLPIVLVTAEGDQESVIKALKAGSNDYILKPVNREVLEKRVKKILAKMSQAVA